MVEAFASKAAVIKFQHNNNLTKGKAYNADNKSIVYFIIGRFVSNLYIPPSLDKALNIVSNV